MTYVSDPRHIFALGMNMLRKLGRCPRPLNRRAHARRATAAVEFAIVAPIFLLFIMGIVEMGRVMMVQNVLISAARDGARAAIISGATADDVKQEAVDYANVCGIAGATATVQPADLNDATADTPITVTVSVTFDDVSWLPVPQFLANQLLSGQTTMRYESID